MISFLLRLAYKGRLIASLVLSVSLITGCGSTNAQIPSAASGPVDLVVVYKSDRLLQLKSQGQVIRSFDVALGDNPEGHKLKEGDDRTPEGVYTLDWRNANSQFHKSIHISYPNQDDRAAAERRGTSPGGLIMIHGLPNGRQAEDLRHPKNDWTDGCVAVTNDEMDEIWSLIEDGTTIIIYP